MWPLRDLGPSVDPDTALKEGGLDFTVSAEPIAAVLPPGVIDLFGSQDDRPTYLDAPTHRALVRDVDGEDPVVLGVASKQYTIAQNKQVLDAALGMARKYVTRPRPISMAAVGRAVGSDVFMAVELAFLSDEVTALLLASNSHSGSGSVRFKHVPVHLPTGTILCPDAVMEDWDERHQGDLGHRLRRLSENWNQNTWIERFLDGFAEGYARLVERECHRREIDSLVSTLWPRTEDHVFAPGNVRLEHPLSYFRDHYADTVSRWEMYIGVCEFLDHYSEARKKNDSTRDRDERIVRGAGDAIKKHAWSLLMSEPA